MAADMCDAFGALMLKMSNDRWLTRLVKLACLFSLSFMPANALAGETYIGAFAHDVSIDVSSHGKEAGQDIDLGYRTAAVMSLRAIGRPMAYADLEVNDAGRTSFGAVGVLWRRRLLDNRLYGQVGLGLAVHDGRDVYANPNEPGLSSAETNRRLMTTLRDKALGSRVLFQPSLGVGWRLTRHLSVEADWVHISNAHILSNINPGLDDLGGRLIWRFPITGSLGQ